MRFELKGGTTRCVSFKPLACRPLKAHSSDDDIWSGLADRT